MKTWVLASLLMAGCLEDGRSEAEYLEDYRRFVDVGPLAQADVGPAVDPVSVRDAETSACSTAPPPDPSFIKVQNTTDELFDIYLVGGDCMEEFAKRLQPISFAGPFAWPGAVFRLRTEAGDFVLEFTVNITPDAETVVELP